MCAISGAAGSTPVGRAHHAPASKTCNALSTHLNSPPAISLSAHNHRARTSMCIEETAGRTDGRPSSPAPPDGILTQAKTTSLSLLIKSSRRMTLAISKLQSSSTHIHTHPYYSGRTSRSEILIIGPHLQPSVITNGLKWKSSVFVRESSHFLNACGAHTPSVFFFNSQRVTELVRLRFFLCRVDFIYSAVKEFAKRG